MFRLKPSHSLFTKEHIRVCDWHLSQRRVYFSLWWNWQLVCFISFLSILYVTPPSLTLVCHDVYYFCNCPPLYMSLAFDFHDLSLDVKWHSLETFTEVVSRFAWKLHPFFPFMTDINHNCNCVWYSSSPFPCRASLSFISLREPGWDSRKNKLERQSKPEADSNVTRKTFIPRMND